MIFDILFILALTGIAVLPFIRMAWKSEVETCRFRMFSVRDRLVLLVAQEKLDREGILFGHYYKMSNDVLRLTEKMHFEGLFQALMEGKLSQAKIKEYNALMKQLNQLLKKADTEVRDVITDYYSVLREMTLVNSNLFSMVYVLSQYAFQDAMRDSLVKWAEKHDPKVAHVYRDVETERRQLGLVG